MTYQKIRFTAAAMVVACSISSVIAAITHKDVLPHQLVVTYNSVQSITVPINDGISALVGVQPDQIVQVTVQYSPSQALQTVNLESLDGGTVRSPNDTGAPISIDGTLTFTFQAGHTPGLNQVSLLSGAQPSSIPQEVNVQFWVLDQQNSNLNPPAATAAKPNY
jgi:hypothetical protein